MACMACRMSYAEMPSTDFKFYRKQLLVDADFFFTTSHYVVLSTIDVGNSMRLEKNGKT